MRFLFFVFVTFAAELAILPGLSLAQQSCVTGECHSKFQAGENTHPKDVSCVSCHLNTQEDHAEGKSKPSLAEGICAGCHKDVIEHRYLHAPVEKGECRLCHYPHGDMQNKLLPLEYSFKKFINYQEGEYRLCFSCHKRELLMFPDTSFSTGFRDGVHNLHYLHVNKGKRGVSCKLCHGIHGADQPKMMADAVRFGNWQMPVNFTKTETGGQCSPGCHRPQQYDRKGPR